MIDRTTIIRGPCNITHDGITYYTREGVTLNVTRNSSPVPVDGFGNVDAYYTGLTVTAEFVPHGSLYQATLDKLYAGVGLVPGASLYGATDKPMVITSAAETVTVVNAAITRMPPLSLQASRPPIGAVQFTGLCAKNGDPGELESYITSGSGSSVGTAIQRQSMYSGTFKAAWDPALGSSAWPDVFYSEGGFEVVPTLNLSPVNVDGIGAVDMTVVSVEARVRCNPVGVSPAAIRAALSPVAPGKSLFYAQPDDLPAGPLVLSTEQTGDHYFSVNAALASLSSGAKRWKVDQNRVGQIEFSLLRAYNAAAGTFSALFTLTGRPAEAEE